MLRIKEEYTKCYTDKSMIYFIENYLSTFNAIDRKDVPFKLFPRQKVFLQSTIEHNNLIAIKHRQAGITTVTAGWACGKCVFAGKNSPENILCIANKLDQAVELSNKIVDFLDQVPRWMWGSEFYSRDPNSDKNKKSIYIKRNKNYVELFNGCKIYSRASGPHSARGISAVTVLIMDECAFLEYGVQCYTSAVAAMSAVSGAKVFMVSTPNGKDELYYSIYQKALKGENNFHAVEFKWFQDLRYNRHLKWYKQNKRSGSYDWDVDTVVDKKGNIVYDEERWRKLEREGWTPTSPWFESMCKTFNNDEQKIAQELSISFLGSADNVVPIEVIDFHRDTNVIKITDDWPLRDNFIKDTWIWKDPIPDHRYIIGVDPSSGAGTDFTAIEVIDIDAIDDNGVPFFEQVLEYNGKINGEEIAELVNRYGEVYNDALVVIECLGGYGDSPTLRLRDFYNYPNLYYDNTLAMRNYTTDYAKKLYKVKDEDKLPGFRSNGLRIQMVNTFVEMLKNNSFRVRSERVISELDTWVFKNGRPDHQTGMNDDLLTCLSMTLFVMQFYMLRTEKMKAKDTSIVRSWYVNNGGASVQNNISNGNKINISDIKRASRNFSPFSSTMDDRDKSLLNACIMLGGFNIKK